MTSDLTAGGGKVPAAEYMISNILMTAPTYMYTSRPGCRCQILALNMFISLVFLRYITVFTLMQLSSHEDTTHKTNVMQQNHMDRDFL